MNQELISVIIPVYNVAPYLIESLDSVIQQTYFNLEIIIVDDGSDDGSEAICDLYSKMDSRIRVIHQKNRGLSVARNIGLDIMTGKFVTFLDSDDAYDKNFISKMISAMNRTNADIVVCSHTNYTTEGRISINEALKTKYNNDYSLYDRIEALQALAMFSITSYVWNKLYRKELWDHIRFPEGHVYEDIATTFRVLEISNRVCVLEESLYLRRIRRNSITNSISERSIRDCLTACISFENYIKDNIPRFFSSDHLKYRQSSRLNQMIQYYLRFYSKTKTTETNYQAELRHQISLLGSNVGLGYTSFRNKLYYYLITKCYWILDLSYPLYLSARDSLHN